MPNKIVVSLGPSVPYRGHVKELQKLSVIDRWLLVEAAYALH
jgi:hypothetical protein